MLGPLAEKWDPKNVISMSLLYMRVFGISPVRSCVVAVFADDLHLWRLTESDLLCECLQLIWGDNVRSTVWRTWHVVKRAHEWICCLAKHLDLLLLRIKLVRCFLSWLRVRLEVSGLDQAIRSIALREEIPAWDLRLQCLILPYLILACYFLSTVRTNDLISVCLWTVNDDLTAVGAHDPRLLDHRTATTLFFNLLLLLLNLLLHQHLLFDRFLNYRVWH